MQTAGSIERHERQGGPWDETGRFPGRIITISREPGARGAEVAREVAARMGLDFYDRDLLTRMAAEAHVSRLAAARPADCRRGDTPDWLAPIARMERLSPYEYSHHLGEVVAAIAACGDAVILGRGAHLMLPPGLALRVLVQAPLPLRIAAVAEREGLDEAAAQRRVEEMERERRSFLARCFRADEGDTSPFDLRVNTGVLGVDATIAIVCAAAAATGVGRQAGARPIA